LKPEAAQRAYLGFANRYPTSSVAPLALYRAARLMQRDARNGWRAGSMYARLAEQYPHSNEAALTRTPQRETLALAA
jgi:TolA-binding protein